MKTHKIITATTAIVIVLLGLAAQAQQADWKTVPAPVPEPSTWLAGALLLVPLGVSALRSMRKNKNK
jgi:hypothetical protein